MLFYFFQLSFGGQPIALGISALCSSLTIDFISPFSDHLLWKSSLLEFRIGLAGAGKLIHKIVLSNFGCARNAGVPQADSIITIFSFGGWQSSPRRYGRNGKDLHIIE